ncbi:hypothetical protein JCM16358_02010 [Halanaerocella petrolearia]
MKKQIRELAMTGLLIALVAVGTMVIKVPTPATNGYIHLGDSMIYLAAILFGPKVGFLAAGIGSALADLLSGYSHWAGPTFLIKGVEGLIIGYIAQRGYKEVSLRFRDLLAALVGGAWMIGGYFVAGAIMRGSWAAAISSIPGNITQAVGGAAIAFPVIFALLRANLSQVIAD